MRNFGFRPLIIEVLIVLCCIRISDEVFGQFESVTLLGYGEIHQVAVNPSQNLFAASSPRDVRVYTTNYEQVDVIDTSVYAAIAWDSGGNTLAIAKRPTQILLWSSLTSEAFQITDEGNIQFIAWSVNDQFIAASSNGTVRIWDAETYRLINTLAYSEGIRINLAWSPLSSHLAISLYNSVIIYNVLENEVETTFDQVGISPEIAYSPNGLYLATAHGDTTSGARNAVKIWDLESESLQLVINTPVVTALTWSPDGDLLAIATADGMYNSVNFWDPSTGELISSLPNEHKDWVTSIAWMENQTRLLVASRDNSVYLWNFPFSRDRETQQLEYTVLQGYQGNVTSLTWSFDDQRIISTSTDGITRIWDVSSGQTISALRGYALDVWSADLHINTNIIAVGDDETVIRIWDVENQTQLLNLLGHEESNNPTLGHGVSIVRYSPSGVYLASVGFDNTIRLWNANDGTLLHTWVGAGYLVSDLAWHPDGTKLLSAGIELNLWDIDTKQRLQTYHCRDDGSPESLMVGSFNDDGTKLITSTAYETCILNVETGALLNLFPFQSIAVDWQNDTGQVAVITMDEDFTRVAQILDVSTGELQPLLTSASVPTAIAWSHQEDTVAIGFQDGTIQLVRQE